MDDVPQEFEFFDGVAQNVSTASPTVDATSWAEDWDFTYDGYVPGTIDPDWSFTIYIVVICLCVNLSLPLWIHLGKRWGFHDAHDRRRRKAAEWESPYSKGNNGNNGNNNNNNLSKDDVLLKQLDDARSVISGHSFAPGSVVGGNPVSPASVISGSVAMSRAGTHLGFLHRPNDLRGGDAASVFSATSGFTTSGFADALLAARPKRMPHARRHNKTKRIVSSKSCVNGEEESMCSVRKKLDVRMAAEFKKAEMDLLKHRNQEKLGEVTPTSTASDVDLGNVVDDNRSEAAPSILSKLDADAISVRDAVDARDGGKMPHFFGKSSDDSNYITAAWNKLMDIVVFDKEMKKYLALAGHYSAQGILEELLGVVEIAAIGRFMGIRAASAYIVVSTVTGFTGTITTGFYESAGVLIPQANGARNNLMVGRYMQLAILFYILTSLPGAVFWCFFTDDAVLFYKFDEETARMAQMYVYATLPGYFTYGIDAVLYELLNCTGHETYSTWFTLVSSCIHTGIVVGMLYTGVTDLYVLGLFETVSEVVCLTLNFTILVRNGWLDPYWKGLIKTNGLRDGRAVKNVVGTAIPLSFAWILTYGEWEIMTLFCRHMGDTGAEVAAWGLMGYLWSAFETLTDGFGDAAEVRVGFRMGAGQVRIAKLCTDKALYVAFTTAIYSTGLLFILAMYIPGWLTPDPTLQRMIFDIIPLIGFGQILMVWGMVAWAILGAQGRVRIATALEFFISWGIGAPIAAILVFVFNYNIEGIVGGLTVSYTIGTNVYLYMLHTSDWESLSAAVVAQSAAEGQTYNEFDWDDLPDNIQDAAAELGYNKWIWESDDRQPESDDKDWDQLTSAERKAALLLGYNKNSWNGDGDSEEGGDNITSDASSDGSEAWASLSNEAKNAAKILGYTQSIWDNDGSPPTEDKDWDELSPTEQEAAKTLGYTKEKWDVEDSDESDEATSYNTRKTSDGTSTIQDVSRGSSNGSVRSNGIVRNGSVSGSVSGNRSVLEEIIAKCSFDSSDDNTATGKSSIPSVTGITNGITSLLGLSNSEEASKESSTH